MKRAGYDIHKYFLSKYLFLFRNGRPYKNILLQSRYMFNLMKYILWIHVIEAIYRTAFQSFFIAPYAFAFG